MVLLLCLLVSGVAATDFPRADRVVIKKSERLLLLMRGDEIMKSTRIALGLEPEGHKRQEGDFRTP